MVESSCPRQGGRKCIVVSAHRAGCYRKLLLFASVVLLACGLMWLMRSLFGAPLQPVRPAFLPVSAAIMPVMPKQTNAHMPSEDHPPGPLFLPHSRSTSLVVRQPGGSTSRGSGLLCSDVPFVAFFRDWCLCVVACPRVLLAQGLGLLLVASLLCARADGKVSKPYPGLQAKAVMCVAMFFSSALSSCFRTFQRLRCLQLHLTRNLQGMCQPSMSLLLCSLQAISITQEAGDILALGLDGGLSHVKTSESNVLLHEWTSLSEVDLSPASNDSPAITSGLRNLCIELGLGPVANTGEGECFWLSLAAWLRCNTHRAVGSWLPHHGMACQRHSPGKSCPNGLIVFHEPPESWSPLLPKESSMCSGSAFRCCHVLSILALRAAASHPVH